MLFFSWRIFHHVSSSINCPYAFPHYFDNYFEDGKCSWLLNVDDKNRRWMITNIDFFASSWFCPIFTSWTNRLNINWSTGFSTKIKFFSSPPNRTEWRMRSRHKNLIVRTINQFKIEQLNKDNNKTATLYYSSTMCIFIFIQNILNEMFCMCSIYG